MNTHTNLIAPRRYAMFALFGACVVVSAIATRAQLTESGETLAPDDRAQEWARLESSSSESGALSVSESESSDSSFFSSAHSWALPEVTSSQESSASSVDISSSEESSSSSEESSETSMFEQEVSSSAHSWALPESSSSASSAIVETAPAIIANLAADALPGHPSNVSPAFIVARNASIAGEDDLLERLSVSMVRQNDGENVPVEFRVDTEVAGYRVTVLAPNIINPGTYALKAELEPSRQSVRTGGTADTQTIFEQNVAWGTLAANLDRAHYGEGDTATFTFAPLLGDGVAACATLLSGVEPVCDPAGIHTSMAARAEDAAVRFDLQSASGSWSFADALSVEEDPLQFDVRRIAATSVVLGRIETVEIVVTAANGLRGSVTETVPAGFEVLTTVPPASVDERGERGTTIEWEGEWQAGVARTLTYTYRAPAEAPLLALFGPIEAEGEMTARLESSSSSETSSSSQEISSSASSSSGDVIETIETIEIIEESVEETPTASGAIEVQIEEVGTGSSLLSSLLSRFTAALFRDEASLSFTEDRRMQVLIVAGRETADLKTSTLELTATKDHFEAKETATFRLLADVSPEVEADGTLSEETALTTLTESLVDADALRTAVLATIVEEQRGMIAESMADDSANVQDLREAMDEEESSVRRIVDTVRTRVERTIANDETLRGDIADAVQGDAAVRTLLETLVTDDARTEIARAMVEEELSGNEGALADAVSELVGDNAPDLVDRVIEAAGAAPETVDAVVASIEDEALPQAENEAPAALFAVTLTDARGRVTVPAYHFEKGSLLLALDPVPAFAPGVYLLTVTVTDPVTGEVQTFTQDFAWGVLAINPDADTYAPGNIAELHIGVLDDDGAIVCDADVTLIVTAPDGTSVTLSTDDESIETTGTCGIMEAGFIEPDYRTALTLLQEGEYALELTAVTENGERTMRTTIPVESDAPFHIVRNAATRLWPLAPSGMDITVTFNVEVEGSVIDTLPAGFEVVSVTPAADVWLQEDGSTLVRWSGAWSAGETASFMYEYDAPDISPQFYLLGPLQIRSESPVSANP